MSSGAILSELTRNRTSLEAIAIRAARHPTLLPELFEGLNAEKARVKFGCLKVLRLLSKRNPAVLYPKFGELVALLDSENKILQWGGIIILGNLAAVDSYKKIEKILDRYLQPLSGPVLITAANTVGGAAKIAAAKPRLADRIARALIRVEAATYQTAECRNVALSHVVQALNLFFDRLTPRARPPVLAFVRRQLKNPRPAVRRKANRFLKQHGRDNLL